MAPLIVKPICNDLKGFGPFRNGKLSFNFQFGSIFHQRDDGVLKCEVIREIPFIHVEFHHPRACQGGRTRAREGTPRYHSIRCKRGCDVALWVDAGVQLRVFQDHQRVREGGGAVKADRAVGLGKARYIEVAEWTHRCVPLQPNLIHPVFDGGPDGWIVHHEGVGYGDRSCRRDL